MSGRTFAAVGSCLLVALGLWLLTSGDPPDPGPGLAAAAPLPSEPAPDPSPIEGAGAASSTDGREAPPRDNLLYRRPPPEVVARLEESEVFQRRLAEAERQRLAAHRFSQGVSEGSYTPEDVNRSVIAFFETMQLEPILEEDGELFGLEIRSIDPASPLLEAGFAEHDVITRLNGTRLADPAEVPRVLVDLERDLDLCVDREGREICERISLD